MRILYNTGISIYSLAIKLASSRNEKARLMINGHKEIFNYLKKHISGKDDIIWVHASSLGEFEQGRPLIERVKKDKTQYKILLTFFSPSGYEVRKDYKYADYVCYLPLDKPNLAKEFIDIVNPKMAFFIKYEFWANYIYQLHNRNIPIYLVSAIFRPSQIFFKSYGGYFRKMLKLYDKIFVQNEQSFNLLKGLELTNVAISGDTRFDRVIEIAKDAKVLPVIEEFVKGSDFTLVSGSSWPKDEDVFIDYFNNHKEMKLIIAPHETHKEHIDNIISKLKRPYLKYTELVEKDKVTPKGNKAISQADCIIIDCIGLLSSIYRYGNCAYIGGGFGVGIHNVLEAAIYNIPVIFGPNYQKFNEAVKLIDAKGGFSINDKSHFDILVDRFNSDKEYLKECGDNAGKYVTNNAGASDIVINSIFHQ